jgi:hypothetical protein
LPAAQLLNGASPTILLGHSATMLHQSDTADNPIPLLKK